MATAASAFSTIMQNALDRRVIYAGRPDYEPWRKFFPVSTQPWIGENKTLPVKPRPHLGAESRAIGGNLPDDSAPSAPVTRMLLQRSDQCSFAIPVDIDVEQMRLTVDSPVDYLDDKIADSLLAFNRYLDRWLVNDQYGSCAVVEQKYDEDGSAWAHSTVNQYITIDRTATVGSLGRIFPGDQLAIHSGATKDVRVYVRVLWTEGALTLDTISKKDAILVTTTGVTQTSRKLGGNASGGLAAVVAGDRIRTIGSAVDVDGALTARNPYGLDAIASGTLTSFFGVNQTTAGNEWAKPKTYGFGTTEFSTEKFDSAIAAYSQTVPLQEVASVARVHTDHFRTLMADEAMKVRVVRNISQKDSPLIQLGWPADEFVYIAPNGKQIALWVDPMQNYTTIDLIPAGLVQFHDPPVVTMKEEWNESPDGIRWWPSAARSLVYQATRVHLGFLAPGTALYKWMRITGCSVKAYQ